MIRSKLPGQGPTAREFDRQLVELQGRIAGLNRDTAIGRPPPQPQNGSARGKRTCAQTSIWAAKAIHSVESDGRRF